MVTDADYNASELATILELDRRTSRCVIVDDEDGLPHGTMVPLQMSTASWPATVMPFTNPWPALMCPAGTRLTVASRTQPIRGTKVKHLRLAVLATTEGTRMIGSRKHERGMIAVRRSAVLAIGLAIMAKADAQSQCFRKALIAHLVGSREPSKSWSILGSRPCRDSGLASSPSRGRQAILVDQRVIQDYIPAHPIPFPSASG